MTLRTEKLLVWVAIALGTGCGDVPSTDSSAGNVPGAKMQSHVAPTSTTSSETDNGAGEDVAAPESPAPSAPQAPQSPSSAEPDLSAPIKLATADAGADAHSQADADHTDQTDTSATATVGRESLGTTPLPCEVRSVLETSCQSCHARAPGNFAPMALTSREDLMAPAISQPERKVYELVAQRIHSTSAPMPPPTARKLTADELATLDNLLGAELKAGPERCEGTKKRVAYPPPDPSEIEQCYPFFAYSRTDTGKPFLVPTGENYACFAFDIPWPGEAQALQVRIRESAVVHHWVVFDEQLGLPQGTVIVDPNDCSLGATKIYASGLLSDDKELNTPPSVGLEMPSAGSGLKMMLQIHYFNMGEPVEDASGAEICIARMPREHTAAPHNTGALEFELPPHQATDVKTHCTPKYAGDIHLIKTQPHMHSRGVGLETIIERADGSRETLIDVPYDFTNQITYETDVVLKPGDSLATTCHFQNDTDRVIKEGSSTEEEMCMNVLTAWPAGSLNANKTSDGGNGCFE